MSAYMTSQNYCDLLEGHLQSERFFMLRGDTQNAGLHRRAANDLVGFLEQKGWL